MRLREKNKEGEDTMLRRLIFVALTLALIPITTASAGAQSSSSGCLGFPMDTVQSWTDLMPSGGPTERACRMLCMRWAVTCDNMAEASYRCFESLFKNLAILDLADCSLLSSPSKEECTANTKSNRDSQLSNLMSDRDSAQFFCKDELADCLGDCLIM